MKIENIAKESPEFEFTRYFLGTTKATGWFSDRFGTVRRHFDGEFIGTWEDDVFVLSEELRYSDGVVENRQWHIRMDDGGNFSATSDSLVGEASGVQRGNTVNLKYRMYVDLKDDKRWLLKINDWLILQQDGSVHNITEVYKWGFKIGTVSNVFHKPVATSNEDTEAVLGTTGDVSGLLDSNQHVSNQASLNMKTSISANGIHLR